MDHNLNKKDKKRSKSDSSTEMWIISGILDPASNYYDMPEDKKSPTSKYRAISLDLLGDKEWLYENEERLKPYIDLYEETLLTPAMRALRAWEQKMQERQKIFDETEYQIGETSVDGKLINSNVEILDKMFERTPKLWASYFKIQEELLNEESGNSTKGGGHESLSDTGEI